LGDSQLQDSVAKYIYDPFGNILSKAGPLADANTYRFSSKDYHANSGLYYYGYRFYDPNLQRWLNRDPIEEEGAFNLFNFVVNSPLNWVDPFGLDIAIDPGASQEFKDRWNKCLCELSSKPAGKKIVDDLKNNKDIKVNIIPAPESEGPDDVPGTGGSFKAPIIYLDRTDPLGIHPKNSIRKKYPKEIPPSCATLLAHELGHASGELDEGKTVTNFENPVRKERGEKPRKKSHGKSLTRAH
jgi:RHS repeat-associated protein